MSNAPKFNTKSTLKKEINSDVAKATVEQAEDSFIEKSLSAAKPAAQTLKV